MRRFARKTVAAFTALALLGGAPAYFGGDVFKAGIEAEAAKYLVTGECGENLTWTLNKSTGVLTIEGEGEMTKRPWNSYANDYNELIKTVALPDGLTSIGLFAFDNCKNLTDIEIPESVTYIGAGAFSSCESLVSITIPEKVNILNNDVLEGCSALQKVVIMNPDIVFDKPNDDYYFDSVRWSVSNNKKKITRDSAGDRIIENKPYYNGVIFGYPGSTTEEFANGYCAFAPITEGFSVAFTSNGGSGNMEPLTFAEKTELVLPECKFNAWDILHRFAGWEIDGEIKQPGDKIIVEGDTIIKATWGINYPETTTQPFDPGEGVWGDASGDGEVKMNDVVLIMQSLSNADKYGLNGTDDTHITRKGQYWADVESNGNGVTPKDALQIQKYLVELVDSLEPKA